MADYEDVAVVCHRCDAAVELISVRAALMPPTAPDVAPPASSGWSRLFDAIRVELGPLVSAGGLSPVSSPAAPASIGAAA